MEGQPLGNGWDKQCLPVKVDSIIFDGPALEEELLGAISCDGGSESAGRTGGRKLNAGEGNSVFLVDIHHNGC